MKTSFVACAALSTVAALAISLATAAGQEKSFSVRPKTAESLLYRGSVTGTLSWDKGQIHIPRALAARGVKSPTLQNDINLHCYIVTTTPGTAGSLGTTTRKKVGSEPKFEKLTTSGNVVTVHYTVTNLPFDTVLQIDTKPKAGGTFLHSGTTVLRCTDKAPDVSHYDLHYQKAP